MDRIIHCIIVDDEPIAREIIETHLKKINNFKLLASCKNSVEAFKVINQQKVDLIFLDINMPDISGLSFAKSINTNIKIIFTTAYREYAVDGFDLKAVDYLLKPISFERFLQSINKYLNENKVITTVMNREDVSKIEDFFFVRSDRKMIKIEFNQILFVESLSDYVKIHLAQKTVLTRETITNIEAKLPKNEFLRVHRSFIVSINKIDSFTNEIIGINEKEIPISRTFKQKVLETLKLD